MDFQRRKVYSRIRSAVKRKKSRHCVGPKVQGVRGDLETGCDGLRTPDDSPSKLYREHQESPQFPAWVGIWLYLSASKGTAI
jgi:hypothetical protein